MTLFTPSEIYLRDNPDVLNWATQQANARGLQPGQQFQTTVNNLAAQHYTNYGENEGRVWGRGAFAQTDDQGNTQWIYGPETRAPSGTYDIQTATQYGGGNPYQSFADSSGGGGSITSTPTFQPQAVRDNMRRPPEQPSYGMGDWGQFFGGLLGGMSQGLIGGDMRLQPYSQGLLGYPQPQQWAQARPSSAPPGAANTGHNMLWSY